MPVDCSGGVVEKHSRKTAAGEILLTYVACFYVSRNWQRGGGAADGKAISGIRLCEEVERGPKERKQVAPLSGCLIVAIIQNQLVNI